MYKFLVENQYFISFFLLTHSNNTRSFSDVFPDCLDENEELKCGSFYQTICQTLNKSCPIQVRVSELMN